MWSDVDGKYAESWIYEGHEEEVRSLTVHPSGEWMNEWMNDSSDASGEMMLLIKIIVDKSLRR